MKRLKEINLEDGKPTVADALIILKSSINNAKCGNVGCLYIIHGYGSSDKGGAIRDKARQWLNAQPRNGTVKCVINGEDFNLFNFKFKLNNLTWDKQNQKIEELSQHYEMFYEIRGKEIFVNNKWIKFISDNRLLASQRVNKKSI